MFKNNKPYGYWLDIVPGTYSARPFPSVLLISLCSSLGEYTEAPGAHQPCPSLLECPCP